MVKLGVDLLGCSEEEFKANPVRLLYEGYVKANKQATVNQDLYDEAKRIFTKLEEGDKDLLEYWKKFREWTVIDLKKMYKRLMVEFDEYCWESDYSSKQCQSVLDALEMQGILTVDEKGRKSASIYNELVPLLKSDGSSLYLLRDIAAAIDRR